MKFTIRNMIRKDYESVVKIRKTTKALLCNRIMRFIGQLCDKCCDPNGIMRSGRLPASVLGYRGLISACFILRFCFILLLFFRNHRSFLIDLPKKG